MVSHLCFSQLVLVALVWLCVMLQWAWPSDPAAVCPTTPEGSVAKLPFRGKTRKPYPGKSMVCELKLSCFR